MIMKVELRNQHFYQYPTGRFVSIFIMNFLDANEVVTAGDDGIHPNAAGHRQLAAALAPGVRKLVDDPV